jgi:CHASE3 domain sensor protein
VRTPSFDVPTTNGRGRLRLGKRGRLSPDLGVLVGMGSLLALLAVAIVAAVLLIVDLNDDATQLTDSQIQYATAIDAAALNAKAIANDERGFLLSGNPEFVEELETRTGNARAAFAVALSESDNDAQRQAVIAATAGFERWLRAVRGEIAIYRAGDLERAVATSLGRTRTLRKTYEKSLAHAQDLGVDAVQSARSSVSARSTRSVAILLAYLIVALAIGIGVTGWVVRKVLRRRPSEQIGVDARPLTPAEAATALEGPAFWPGPAVNDVELSQIEVVRLMTRWGGKRVTENRALVFQYGPGRGANSSEPWLTITEGTSAEETPRFGVAGAPHLPPGELRLTGFGHADGGEVDMWFASMQRDGVYIALESPQRELILAAAGSMVRLGQKEVGASSGDEVS